MNEWLRGNLFIDSLDDRLDFGLIDLLAAYVLARLINLFMYWLAAWLIIRLLDFLIDYLIDWLDDW